MAVDHFSLCWNNFHSNLSHGFHSLLQSEDLVDVTLAVEGRYLKAHKMVLSVCSQYFKELFKVNPCKHPIVILKDVSYSSLRDLLQFMYVGEVNVSQEELSNLMKVAEMLQIKGLTEDSMEMPFTSQNGIKNIRSLSDARPQKRPKPIKKIKPAPSVKMPRTDENTDPYNAVVENETSLHTEEERDLNEPIMKSEPVDVPNDSEEFSEHSLEIDMSAMVDTSMGESSSQSSVCWKSENVKGYCPDVKAYCPDDNQPPASVQITYNRQGHRQVTIDGFRFHKKVTLGNKAYWYCKYSRKPIKCPSVLWMVGENIVRWPGAHNHPKLFMFTRSRKGMLHLIYDSNLFRPSGKIASPVGLPKNCRKYWECVQNRKTSCRARLMSTNGILEVKCDQHNHDSPKEFIQQRVSSKAIVYMPV